MISAYDYGYWETHRSAAAPWSLGQTPGFGSVPGCCFGTLQQESPPPSAAEKRPTGGFPEKVQRHKKVEKPSQVWFTGILASSLWLIGVFWVFFPPRSHFLNPELPTQLHNWPTASITQVSRYKTQVSVRGATLRIIKKIKYRMLLQ